MTMNENEITEHEIKTFRELHNLLLRAFELLEQMRLAAEEGNVEKTQKLNEVFSNIYHVFAEHLPKNNFMLTLFDEARNSFVNGSKHDLTREDIEFYKAIRKPEKILFLSNEFRSFSQINRQMGTQLLIQIKQFLESQIFRV